MVLNFNDFINENTQTQVIVYNNKNTTFDKLAQKLIMFYFNNNKTKNGLKRFVSALKKTNQKPNDYEFYIYIPINSENYTSFVFSDNVTDAYHSILNADDESNGRMVRISLKNNIYKIVATIEFSLFGDDGDLGDDMYGDNGRLKQFIINNGIERLGGELKFSFD